MAAGPGRRGLALGGGESSLSVESWGSRRGEGRPGPAAPKAACSPSPSTLPIAVLGSDSL